MTPNASAAARHRIADIHDLPAVLPQLFTKSYLATWTCSTNATEAAVDHFDHVDGGMMAVDGGIGGGIGVDAAGAEREEGGEGHVGVLEV